MNNRIRSVSLLAICLGLAACAGPSYKAPVVDRLPARSLSSQVSPDGYYTVKPGDTLYSIALDFGLDWRDLARANGLSDPSKLAIGQKILVEGLGTGAVANSDAGSTVNGDIEVRPIDGGQSGTVARPIAVPEPPAEQKPKPSNEGLAANFIWPHDGKLISGFKPGVNKGIDLAANVGDPVKASQAGKVVYAGNALRGYGNLIIVKHNNNLLTAYAHNKTLLVKEGDTVKQGQKIAEAGQSDADRPKLHFEVRKAGKPVNPLEYLPAR